MERLGWPPAGGTGARISGQAKSGMERRVFKFSKGASSGEPSLPAFAIRADRVAMPGSLGDRGMKIDCDARGTTALARTV
ncbi:MAG: hypothetical protein P4N59_10195 [Negativicutes bacterium]|nr:hypothetical protein [Negativicutes bacterium]